MKQTLKKLVSLSSLGLILGGCAPDAIVSAIKVMMGMEVAKVWLEEVKFKQEDNVNNNAPVTVDILIAYDKDTFAQLAKMPADKYFADKEQLKKDLYNHIEIFSFEVVPGQKLHDQTITPSKSTGVGCLIFAHYSTPGPHRAVAGPDRVILLELGKLDFKISPYLEE
jgi:type VI secretion system protein